MIKMSVSNSLRKRLLGTGNIYFYHSVGKEGEAWHWAEGKNTEREVGGVTYGQKEGHLGVLQEWQNKLAQLLDNYLWQMRNTALKIFKTGYYFSVNYKKNKGGQPFEYPEYDKETRQYTGNVKSTQPIADHFFSGVTKRGKLIQGSFGNTSDHALYVEWGTGPIGKANKGALPRSMRERRGMPKYRSTPWVYYNPAFEGFVTTKGMAPRPFVYPAFLRLRSAFVNDCKAVLRGLNEGYFSHEHLKPWERPDEQ